MYGYIYEVTNLVNNKKYIGKHRSSSFDENYKGSGKLIREALKKYGSKNFIVRLVDTASSRDELNEKEILYIAECDAVNSDMYYNLSTGGDGGNFSGWHQSDYQKQIASKTHKGKAISEEAVKKIKDGIKHMSDEKKKERSDKCRANQLGKKQSAQTCQRKSESLMGRRPSKDTVIKMKQAQKKRAERLKSEGKNVFEKPFNAKDTVWVHKFNADGTKESHMVKSEELQTYIAIGYKKGRGRIK